MDDVPGPVARILRENADLVMQVSPPPNPPSTSHSRGSLLAPPRRVENTARLNANMQNL